jgi:hypothetical protein
MFASILSVAHNLGYPALVRLVMLESSGVSVARPFRRLQCARMSPARS